MSKKAGPYDAFDFVGSTGNPHDWDLSDNPRREGISSSDGMASTSSLNPESYGQFQQRITSIDLSSGRFNHLPLDSEEISKKQQSNQQQQQQSSKEYPPPPIRPSAFSIPAPPQFYEDPLQSNADYSYHQNRYNINSTSALSRIDSLAPTFDFSSEEDDDNQSTRYVLGSQGHDENYYPHSNSNPEINSRSPLRPQFDLPSDFNNEEIQPQSRSRSQKQNKDYPKGNALGRRKTLIAKIKRVSLRVVNLAAIEGEDLTRDGTNPSGIKHPHMRIDDREDGVVSDGEGIEIEEEEIEEEFDLGELRGNTLGIFSPSNWFRIACARALHWRYVSLTLTL